MVDKYINSAGGLKLNGSDDEKKIQLFDIK